MSFIYKYKTLHGFIKGVSGGFFVLINKWCYPQSAFIHNLGPTIYFSILANSDLSYCQPFWMLPKQYFAQNMALPSIESRCRSQCDQIGRFFSLLAIIQSRWKQLFYPNWPHLLGNFCNGVKIIHFSSEIIFGQLL